MTRYSNYWDAVEGTTLIDYEHRDMIPRVLVDEQRYREAVRLLRAHHRAVMLLGRNDGIEHADDCETCAFLTEEDAAADTKTDTDLCQEDIADDGHTMYPQFANEEDTND